MVRDGYQPAQQRAWYYWTIPGQFDTIAQEIEMAKSPSRSFDRPTASSVMLWAEFDERYGYPRRFRRVVLGTDLEIDWTITRFTPLEPSREK
jgi:hypothetical protein